MKILHFITTMSAGGAERMLSKLATSDDEHEHVIITLLKGDLHYDIKNVKIIHLNYENNIFSKIICIFTMKKIIRKEKPDIIQTWLKLNYYGPLLKLFEDAKLVSNYRNGYNDKFNKIFINFLNLWNKAFDYNIFVSKSSLIERELNGFKFKNKTIINNGFTPQDYSPLFENNQVIFGHIGRFHPIKNQQLIINSFNSFSIKKEVQLIMAGKDLKEKLYDVNNPKIKFLGNIKNTEQFYKNIDVMILTSYSEGFPNVIGESMSFGVPVIASNAGESHEIIGESGYKLYGNTEEELTSVFNEIYRNKSELNDRSKLAKSIISQKYDFNLIIYRYQKLYSSL